MPESRRELLGDGGLARCRRPEECDDLVVQRRSCAVGHPGPPPAASVTRKSVRVVSRTVPRRASCGASGGDERRHATAERRRRRALDRARRRARPGAPGPTKLTVVLRRVRPRSERGVGATRALDEHLLDAADALRVPRRPRSRCTTSTSSSSRACFTSSGTCVGQRRGLRSRAGREDERERAVVTAPPRRARASPRSRRPSRRGSRR